MRTGVWRRSAADAVTHDLEGDSSPEGASAREELDAMGQDGELRFVYRLGTLSIPLGKMVFPA